MQLMPTTGQALKVGDITVTESNIHGGSKYMDQLMTQYFQGREVRQPEPDPLLPFASYKRPGRANISKMRTGSREARTSTPDKWFNNVEVVTAEEDRHRDHHVRAQHLQVFTSPTG